MHVGCETCSSGNLAIFTAIRRAAINHWLSFKARSHTVRDKTLLLTSNSKKPLSARLPAGARPRYVAMLARIISFEILFLAAGCILLVGMAHWF